MVASAVKKGLDFKIKSICCPEKLLILKSIMKYNVINQITSQADTQALYR